jgi:hypothetical protein
MLGQAAKLEAGVAGTAWPVILAECIRGEQSNQEAVQH